MTFKQHQDSLRAKRYNPLPSDEANQLVINREELDKVANSLQRLIIKSMSKILNFNTTHDSTLFEYVSIANAAIAEAMEIYTDDKVDFALFSHYHINNAFFYYNKLNSSTVKSSIVKGKRCYASYLHIDAPISDEVDRFELPYYEEREVFSIDLKMLYDLIKAEHHLFKYKYMEIYAAYIGLDGNGGLKNVEIAEEFGISSQRAYQIISDVEKKIKANEMARKYLEEFI